MPSHFHYPISKVERLCRKFYSQALQQLGLSPHVVRAQGARFRVDPTELIDQCIAYDGIWEPEQLEELADISRKRRVSCFIDVGANTGFYSIMFAQKKLADRIIAFEPDPGNFARFEANIALNDFGKRIEAVPIALGDQNGEVTLYEGASWNRGESTIAEPDQTPKEKIHRVRQVRFDEVYALAKQNIIIKMDVEGYEFHALAGMGRTLKENLCYLQVELYSNRLSELKDYLARLGYRFLHTEYIDHFFTNMADIG